MAVTGLGDYEVVDDGVTDGASDGGRGQGVDRSVPPGDATEPPPDGGGITPREDQAAPPVDAGDGGQDAGHDGGRSGVRCSSSLVCSGGLNDVCCLPQQAALSCTSFFLCAIVTNVRLYACDEDRDCSGDGSSKCCAIMSGSTANSTVCRVACQASEEHVCVDAADCTAPKTCTSASPDGTLLPLLRVCR